MQEIQVQSLGREDFLEKGIATYSSILVWRISGTERSLAGYRSWGCRETDLTESDPCLLYFPFSMAWSSLYFCLSGYHLLGTSVNFYSDIFPFHIIES